MYKKMFQYIEDIEGEPTAHLSGLKKVFLENGDTESHLTQFAFGTFKPNEVCERHMHPTMDELFYFIEGNGVYKIEGEEVLIKPGTFLRIPAGKRHELINSGQTDLNFVYFGIALD